MGLKNSALYHHTVYKAHKMQKKKKKKKKNPLNKQTKIVQSKPGLTK